MTDKTAVEAMARELAGHFGPLFEELPKDKGTLRAWRREGFCVSDNTQDEMISAAQAALDALKANGFAVVPVEPTSRMLWDGCESYGDKFYFNQDHAANCYRAMIAAVEGGE